MTTHIQTHTAILLTGTNQGFLNENLKFAENQISTIGKITSISNRYGSEAWGFSSQDFQNQAIKISTSLSPQELLKETQRIEIEAGRKPKKTDNYEARILDIDIIFYDDIILESTELIIPHPHMTKRKFVLEPLNEIIPNYLHPKLQKRVSSLLSSCEDKSNVWLIED
jgi:2-amino-4-hydroxy-6-hydroxymethyldihydropteridine diphosphokinase